MGEDYNPNSVNAVLARMEQKQSDNGEKLDTAITKLSEIADRHDKRIQSLEGSRKYGLGIVAGVSFAFNGAVEGIKHFLSK